MNILNEFCMELGYANATNQYVELAVRYFEKDYSSEELKVVAQKVGLSVSTLPERYTTRIAKSYIVGIHSSIETFLTAFKELEGNPTEHVKPFEAEKDGNKLWWTLKACYVDDIPPEVRTYYDICNYYRLVRNEIVHAGRQKSEYRIAKSKVANLRDSLLEPDLCERLNAPNDVEELTFDDQVLFSRVAKKICGKIYGDSDYDWQKILEYNRKAIAKIVCKVCKDDSKTKLKIINYLSQVYPTQDDSNLIQALDSFVV